MWGLESADGAGSQLHGVGVLVINTLMHAKTKMKRGLQVMTILTNRLVLMILPALLRSVSPILIAQMQPLIDQLRETARSTPNPWDDILIVFLEEILGEILAQGPTG